MTPEEFRKMRKAARMTQAQMAERLDVSRKTIVNWETGVFSIPDAALDTLTEKGVAAAPEPIKALDEKTNPEMFNPLPRGARTKGVVRNHRHPHWWTRSLWNYMTKAQQAAAGAIASTTDDAKNIVWTPERAVVFTMNFIKKSREQAEDIVRGAGFALPPSGKALDHAQYLADRETYKKIDPDGGWRGFEEMFPQYRERTAPAEQTPEQRTKSLSLNAALDAAFKNLGENND